MYKLSLREDFRRKYQKLTRRNSMLKEKIDNILVTLEENPIAPSLKLIKFKVNILE
jgi:mRNA-degrading endonuclease YafQ of YafQ-DinJ toxin-antitoxin module